MQFAEEKPQIPIDSKSGTRNEFTKSSN